VTQVDDATAGRTATRYVLGSDDVEITRLDAQAAVLAPATAVLLRAAGIVPGMRVLDLGTGLGHVAFAVAELVGPGGAVVGLDAAPRMLEVAEERRRALGLGHVRFAEGDARTYRDPEPFDAIVCRLLLFHLPDAVDVVRHHVGGLRPGGTFAAFDFDLGASRSEPPIPLVAIGLGWVEEAFRRAQADPRIGIRLGPVLRDAGCQDVEGFGVQAYLPPGDERAASLLSGVVRALEASIVAAGIATAAEVAAFHAQLPRKVAAVPTTVLPPTLAGAWGRRAAPAR
jgi:SAM-dependent methyltransferase